jgi:hypothetical protein
MLIRVAHRKMYHFNQCCGSGSGSVCFWGVPDMDPDPLVRVKDLAPEPAPDPSNFKQK